MTDVTPPSPLTFAPLQAPTPERPANVGAEQAFHDQDSHRIDVDSTRQGSRTPPTPLRRSLYVLAGMLAGAGGGFVLGGAMRGFMRLISDEPEFTWSGTIFVVMVFVIFGATQGLAAGGRKAGLRRRWLTPLRLIGGFGMLATMGAAGAIMAPTTLGAGLARHRRDWPRWARVLCAVLAAANVTTVSVMTLSGQAGNIEPWLGLLLMVACYTVVVAAVGQTLAPQPDGWHLPRWARVTVAVCLVVPALLLTVMAVGLRS